MKMMQSVALFVPARGGSCLFNDVIWRLLEPKGYMIKDFMGDAYDAGLNPDDIPSEVFEKEFQPYLGYYGPFRTVPQNLRLSLLEYIFPIIIVRDPRDCLVSNYFAMKNRHSIFDGSPIEHQRKGLGDLVGNINEYCMSNSLSYLRTFEYFSEILSANAEAKFWRYEDIFYDPVHWLSEIGELLNISNLESIKDAIAMLDFSVEKEDEHAHKRQAAPGDYLRKLSPACIAALNKEFAHVDKIFGYLPSGSGANLR